MGPKPKNRGLRWTTGSLTVAMLMLTACGGPATGLPGVPGGSSEAYQQVIDNAPVADAAAFRAGGLLAKIHARGTLNVGGTDTAALFSLRDPMTGKLSGFDAGLAAMLARYLTGKPNINLVLASADTREVLLRNGSVDAVLATYTITAKRAEQVAFAGPYYSSGAAILAKKSNGSIRGVADLAGKTVCTETNSTSANDIKKFSPTAKILLLESNNECVEAVKQGRADAYVLDQAIQIGNAYRNPDLAVVGQPFTQDPYGIGLPPGDAEMKSAVNTWLKTIQKSGAWAKLWKATIGTAVSGAAPAPPAIGSVPGS